MSKRDNLLAVFLSEAHELLTSLEQGLLSLEVNPSDNESIHSVFRVMHTLKGSASMFGFDGVSELTHNLETIFDAVRHNQQILTSEVIKVSLQSLDLIAQHLASPQGSVELQGKQQALLSEIKAVSTINVNPVLLDPIVERTSRVYYISFIPRPTIFRNGTNTLFLIDDLLQLGTGLALPYFHNLPSLERLEVANNYLHFEVVLETSKPESEIRDVFMFVEDECTLEVLPITGITALDSLKIASLTKISGTGAVGPKAIADLLMKQEKSSSSLADKIRKAVSGTNVSSIRVDATRIDELMNLVSELVTTQASLGLFSSQSQSQELMAISESMEKITRRLRDNAFTMSLIPIESIVVRFQRLVRDLSKELNKKIHFKTEGTETEIDKSIIEKLADPLLHLLRNSMDHGIETPMERKLKGKPEEGLVQLRAYHAGANVIIEIKDDGAGINLGRVRKKAIEKGLIAPQDELTKDELIQLIFKPGFSTAETVSGVSGRGVGMDVVHRSITNLRGEVDVQTEPNEGSSFIIRLPLMLSIIDGLLVKVDGTNYILPMHAVEKCYEVETSHIESTFNQWITLEDNRIPFIYLRERFAVSGQVPPFSQIIKVLFNAKPVGLVVDEIVGEYQAVMKPLGKYYHGQDEFTGATILGDGSVALVIDPKRLVRKFSDHQEMIA